MYNFWCFYFTYADRLVYMV